MSAAVEWDPFGGVPSVVGSRYVIREEIGRGGLAVVHRAFDREQEREVAVKLFEAPVFDKHAQGSRFRAEAKAMARLRHRHLVQVSAAGRTAGYYWYVMQLMRGGTWRDYVEREGPLPVPRVVAMTRDLADALSYVHGEGIVHRDIKPHNILLDGKGRSQLADFGIARHPTGSVSFETKSYASMGTVGYTAPEQRLDPRFVSKAADIYSVGAVMFYLSTGERPDELQLEFRPTDVHDAVPEPLRAIVSRATAYEANDRYGCIEDLGRDLPSSWFGRWKARLGF